MYHVLLSFPGLSVLRHVPYGAWLRSTEKDESGNISIGNKSVDPGVGREIIHETDRV